MSDFEDRVKRLMQDNVDQVAGPRRAAPPFARPGASGRGRGGGSRRAPWIAPLLAAACVALVAGVTAGTVQLLSDKAPVATQPPSPPPPTSSVVPSPTTSRTGAPTKHKNVAPNPNPSTQRVARGSNPTSTHSSRAVATQTVIVRPVAADGTIAPGYHTKTKSFGAPFNCFGASFQAVDPGIADCGYGYTSTPACWHAANPVYVLCLFEPQSHELIRVRLDGNFPKVTPRVHPLPQSIVLDYDGVTCYMPTGGARGRLDHHPQWSLDYYCADKQYDTVYSSSYDDPIDKSKPAWTVHVFTKMSDPGTVRTVRTAYYFGTAK